MANNDKKGFFDRLREDERAKKTGAFFGFYYIEVLAALLMIIGLITSVFEIYVGGLLVGLATGMAFFAEIHAAIASLGLFYTQNGVFKMAMLIGVIIYLLISVPTFLIGIALAYGIITLIRLTFGKK